MDKDRMKKIKAYCDDRAQGKSHAVAVQKAGISHSTCERVWLHDQRNPSKVTLFKGWDSLTEAQRNALIVEARAAKTSWGVIAAKTGHNPIGDLTSNALSESAVRNAFGKATGLASEGTRIDRGGRFLSNDQRLYVGNHKGIGVEADRPRQVDRDALKVKADEYKSVLPRKVAAAKAAAKRKAKAVTPKPTAEPKTEAAPAADEDQDS